jgi:hypothetical protein
MRDRFLVGGSWIGYENHEAPEKIGGLQDARVSSYLYSITLLLAHQFAFDKDL